MMTLLKKEFGLTGALVTYCFIATGLMALIPNYPILAGVLISCIGLIGTFQFAREAHDVNYLATLPIKKRDVVKAKYLFVIAIEAITYAIIVLIVILRSTLMANATPYVNNPLMNANVAYLGYVLICYAMFNLVFLGLFYQTAYSFLKPSVCFFVVLTLLIIVFETIHHFPALIVLNNTRPNLKQFVVLIIGAVIYLVSTFVSFKASAKNYEKIDL